MGVNLESGGLHAQERPVEERGSESDDSEQKLRWIELLDKSQFQKEEEVGLLKAMELLEDEEQGQIEENAELSQVIVAAIKVAKSFGNELKGAGKKRRPREEKWGPNVVERNRRKQNNGTSMLQKAMELKKKKNPESVKGNSISVLQAENLAKIADDINLLVGSDIAESSRIIDNLIEVEKQNFDQFMEDHPDVMLPTNLDVCCNYPKVVNNQENVENIGTPTNSLKEGKLSPSWTEVVRRGGDRKETKIDGKDDRRVLKY
jgi:hypothetical protein